MVLAAALLVAAQTTAPPAPAREADFNELEAAALAELRETGTPGAAVAVVKGDRVVFAKGFGVGSVETGAPVSADTLFRVGSVTKMLTAAALCTLVEEGRLRLDAPVGTYAKGLAPRLAQVTAHQLLSQTSGLRDVPGGDGLHDEAALGEFARALKDEDQLIAPGRAFSYSNAGYALAGYLLERLTGKPYADAMGERLFAPLGMTRTTLRPTVAMTYPLAVGHDAKAQGQPPAVVRPLADDTRLWPAGYAFTSLNDLARFVVALMNGGRLGGRQALPAGAAARLLSPSVPIPTGVFPNGEYTYGLFAHDFAGTRMFEHGGTLPGYNAEVRMLPAERVAVIVLNNRDGVRLNKTFARAFELAAPSVKAAAPAATAPATLPLGDAEAARLAGTYTNRWQIELVARGGRLFLRQFGSELPVTKLGEGRFNAAPPGAARGQQFLILPGADGRPAHLQMSLWVFKRV